MNTLRTKKLDIVSFEIRVQREENIYSLHERGKWVSKLMSTFGTLNEVQAHVTFRRMTGGDFNFKYPEPFSWHIKAKHWVDDHNQS